MVAITRTTLAPLDLDEERQYTRRLAANIWAKAILVITRTEVAHPCVRCFQTIPAGLTVLSWTRETNAGKKFGEYFHWHCAESDGLIRFTGPWEGGER